ncbi:glycosyltransferase family 2 protein [Moraxella nasibovis]|uniref:glycosyltransferase family 2 protein n=1 Tax=Moraxella nasibovis TaxID=2904120 RepID=UPI002410819F|nr:glycosyltransferase family 2 protein [Moraxella nasibovis]WFF38739.1 glycosyltransferase family 2 protein [Moraxella nasibovis]
MFVIPMAGLSSRFFKAGYEVPKYQLDMGGKTVFARSLESFKTYFETDLFVIILRDVYDTKAFVEREMQNLGIKNYQLCVLDGETEGQAETVYLGTQDASNDEELYIFNIDTFRHGFKKPEFATECDGYLEVFKGEGDHWSFVGIDENDRVVRTTEKERISDLCSNGLYYFRKAGEFKALFERTKSEKLYVKGELYIAPMYNLMLEQGADIRYDLIELSQIDFCGTPDEYVALKEKYQTA